MPSGGERISRLIFIWAKFFKQGPLELARGPKIGGGGKGALLSGF